MTVLKYVKLGSARFISHIELLRHMARIMRRAGIEVNFSLGFNPHALLFFSPPLVLGAGSEAEYVSIDSPMPSEEVFERYNRSVPQDLKAVAYFSCDKNPNLQYKIAAADYVFPTPFAGVEIERDLTAEYEKKGERFSENVGERIYGVFDVQGRLGMRLASGNVNLRADRAAFAVNARFGRDIAVAEILKTKQYVLIGDEYKDADTALALKLL